jgi:hypothetical protein
MFTKIVKQCLVISFVMLSAGCHVLFAQAQVTLTHGADESAGDVSAYIIKISNATFYLEKEGGGLSSMLDSEGVDWIGFNNTKGSGWKGEYRGFPNAIHKQDGNYFHAMNKGTDKSSSYIAIETGQHVQIIFTSDNGKWQGQWDFYPDRCDFSMTKTSQDYHYWVQYEGVPGGEMDDSDFWYASVDDKAHPIKEAFIGDLPAPEWFAFGDEKTSRMIYLLHHQDDGYPDNYVSRPFMTVLGFGRSEKNKYLDTPQTFSIGFVESTDYQVIENTIKEIID